MNFWNTVIGGIMNSCSPIKLSIVLPCYNEGTTLAKLLEWYRTTFRGVDGIELVLVDNGSTDDTARSLEAETTKSNPFILKVVTIVVNQGYGHGIMTGISQATGEFIAWSHADLQCSPEDVLCLYNEVMKKPIPKKCFGKGYRVNDRGKAVIFTRLQTFLSQRILGHNLEEINAQPKLFHRDFIREFRHPPEGYQLDVYAYFKAAQAKQEIVTVDVVFHERSAGQSRWAYSLYARLCFIINNFIYLLKLRLLANRL